MSLNTEQSQNIELQVQETAQAGTPLRYTFINRSTWGALTSSGFSLDRDGAGIWEPVNLGLALTGVGIIVKPGQSRDATAPLPRDLVAGVYRFRKRYRLGPPGDGSGWDWPRGGPPQFEAVATFSVLS